MQSLRDVDVVLADSVDLVDSETDSAALVAVEEAVEEAVVDANGEFQEKAAVVPTAAVVLDVPILVVDVDAAAAQTSTSPSRLVPVSTTLAANVVRRSHQKANANGRATGLAVVNVLHLSLSSNH